MANELKNSGKNTGYVKIIFGTTTVELNKMASNFKAKNVLTYQKDPSRTNDFTLQNRDIEARYVPTVEFIFNYFTAADYALLLQLTNSKGFFVQYYDYEIQTWVQRRMYATEQSIENIRNIGPDYEGALGAKVTFVSVFGYRYCETTDTNFSLANKLHYYYVYSAATETRESA